MDEPIDPANYLFRSLPDESGEHEIPQCEVRLDGEDRIAYLNATTLFYNKGDIYSEAFKNGNEDGYKIIQHSPKFNDAEWDHCEFTAALTLSHPMDPPIIEIRCDGLISRNLRSRKRRRSFFRREDEVQRKRFCIFFWYYSPIILFNPDGSYKDSLGYKPGLEAFKDIAMNGMDAMCMRMFTPRISPDDGIDFYRGTYYLE